MQAERSEIRVSKTLINPQKYTITSLDEPAVNYTAYIDQLEENELTIRDLQERISKKLGGGWIHFVETSQQKAVDPEKLVKYYKDATPLHYMYQQQANIEPDKTLNIKPFTCELAPNISGERLFGTIWSITKVLPGDFYLMLVRDQEAKPLSRSKTKLDLSAKALNGAKIVMKPLKRDAISIKVKMTTRKDPLVYQIGIKTTFYELKEMIDDRENIPSDQIKLTFNSDTMGDNKILTESGVSDGSLIEFYRAQ